MYQYDYINERLRRYNAQPSDDLLYRIGTHVDVLTSEDGQLTPKDRFEVLNWLECKGFQIDHDLALLIFGREQLTKWLETSRQAYPNFEFYLVFEYQEREKTGWESGVNYTMHWTPRPGAPVPETDNDFPWKSFWDCGDLFWGEFPGGYKNEFDFNLHVYPDEISFTKLGWVCEEGDWYTTLDEQDASLMSVAQVLEQFGVQV